MLREEAASIAGYLITQVLLVVNADKRQISLIPLLLKLLVLSLQKCYMKMIWSNSIRDHLKHFFLRSSLQRSHLKRNNEQLPDQLFPLGSRSKVNYF